jgi:hypothetical protein
VKDPVARKKYLTASERRSLAELIVLHRGEDVDLEFQLAPPSDCTGWTITLKVAPTLGGSVSTTKTATIVDGPRGRFRISLASADTSGLTVGRQVWDVRRTDSGSKVTLAEGTLDLRQEVTA